MKNGFVEKNQIEVVNAYKYLGLYFTTKLRFSTACSDLAATARGKRAIMGILSVLYKFDNQSMKPFGKLFDSKVQSVLLYAAEIWGLEDDYCYQTENTHHMFALKRFLGVGQMTPNNMIYGNTARYPLYINAYVRAVRYWLKITRMNEKRLPYKAYLML